METIKNTVANVLGTNKSHETDATTDSTLGHHDATSGTTTDSTVGHSTTGTSGTTSDAAPSFHDRTTTGGDSTLSHGTPGTSTTGTSGLSSGGTAGVSQAGTGTSTTGASDLSSGRDTTATSGTTGLGHSTSHTSHSHDSKSDELSPTRSHPDRKEVQSPDQGPDPNLVGDASGHPKMVGQGAPGSHSAVFGLTPDGKKHDESSHGATPIRPAHSDETTLGRKSVAAGASGADTGGDTVSGGHGGVSDQIDAPDAGKKGLQRTDPAPISEANSGGKPGAGLTGLGQS